MNQPDGSIGVRIRGTGSSAPKRHLTNADLEKMVDTSDEWIQQRTGIKERRICDPETEGTFTMSRDSLTNALDAAGLKGSDLDLVIVATCTPEMTCPSVACRVAAAVGAIPAGAFDLTAACSGFVYGLNIADTMIRSGRYRRIGVIGADAMSSVIDYTERTISILFGDGSGAAVLEADENPERGCLYQLMESDGSDWHSLYMPRRQVEAAEGETTQGPCDIDLGRLRMNGREVYKFAVNKFRQIIEDALEKTGLGIDDVSQFVCHQSNIRIIESACEKLGLDRDRVYTNIDRYGNTSAGSVGLCLDELTRSGKCSEGEIVLFVAFGGGLTWTSSVWRM